jgi:hypothetical protein
LEKLILNGMISYTRYEDAFLARTLNAFSTDFLGENEKATKKGASAEYRLNRNLTIAADYLNYEYQTMGNANYFGTQLSARLYGISTGLSLHRMSGETERLRYTMARIFAVKDIEKMSFSADALNVHYDKPYNSLENAYSVNGTIRYKISNSLIAGVSLDYSKTPDFTNETRVLLNIIYNKRIGI